MKLAGPVLILAVAFGIVACDTARDAHADAVPAPPKISRPGEVLTIKGRVARVHKTGAHAGCVFLHYGEVTSQRVSDDPRDGEWYCAR